jgi:tetratricopeptide (TPR) repeat protein
MTAAERIDDLRRRIASDPTSIAFAQLAEELRRAGRPGEAIEVSLAGLEIYPDHASARITLGRALVELKQLEKAQPDTAPPISAPAPRDAGTAALATPSPTPSAAPDAPTIGEEELLRIVRTLSALESWLSAIYVTRAERRA